MRWYGIDSERLSRLLRRLDELESAIAGIGSLHDSDGDRLRDEARRLASESADTARRVLVEFTVGTLSARWFAEWGGEYAGWWVERHVFTTTRADVVLRDMLEHPERAGAFVDDLTNPEALVHGVNDFDALKRFWEMVTDPEMVPEDVAMSRIRTLLRGLFAERYWENVPATRIEDPTMKTRNALLVSAVATAIASWQLNLPGMLGEIGTASEEGREALIRLAEHEQITAEMRALLPEVFARSLDHFPARRPDQARFISALGRASGMVLTGMQTWTIEEMKINLGVLRELGEIVSLVPGPYLATTVPSAAMSFVFPSEPPPTSLTDAELLEINQLRVDMANAASNAMLEREIAAGRHRRGSTDYSDDLLYDMMTIRWAFDGPFERGRLWRELDVYHDVENLEEDVVAEPERWLEIIEEEHVTQPDGGRGVGSNDDLQGPLAGVGESDSTDEVIGARVGDRDGERNRPVAWWSGAHLE